MCNNVTVIICCFNAEAYLKETLLALTKQEFKEFDILIIDDSSTDNTLRLARSFIAANNIKADIITFDINKGIANARKYALEYINTTYYIFLDSDDIPYPQLVGRLYHKIENDSDLMAVGCYLEYIDKKGSKIGGGLFIGAKTKKAFFEKAKKRKLIFMQPTAIVRRDLALRVGGFITVGYFDGKPRYQDFCEDLDLWTRMSDLYTEGKAIIVIPEVLCQYLKMENTASANTLGMLLKIQFVKENLIKRRTKNKELSFIEFYNSLTKSEINKLEKKAKAVTCLKKGVLQLKNKRVGKGLLNIMHSIFLNPVYFFGKLKFNYVRRII